MVYEFGVRLAGRQESGGPSLGRNPGAQKAASTRQSTPNPNSRENRVDTIFGAGLTALLFFSQSIIMIADHVIGKSDRRKL
jgi:hypothetical protein